MTREILRYEDEIFDLIQREKLLGEGDRGLAVYLDDESIQKVYYMASIHRLRNGELLSMVDERMYKFKKANKTKRILQIQILTRE